MSFSVNNRGDKSAEMLLYDYIGGDGMGGGCTAKDFINALNDLGAIDSLDLRINSPGGNVFDASAIYNALVQHPAKVNCYIDGMAASSASWIAMSGDRRYMADNAMMMIHNAQGVTFGDASEHIKMADTLEKMDGMIAKTYADRSGRKAGTFKNLMDEETWFTAQEAKDQKLVDEIIPGKKMAACFDLEKLKFKNAPAERLAAIFDSGKPPESAPVEAAAVVVDTPKLPTPDQIAKRLRVIELDEAM